MAMIIYDFSLKSHFTATTAIKIAKFSHCARIFHTSWGW